MEVFAGFLEHTDHHIGRLLDFLETIGELDNTLIMVISDNGASAEGGPTGSVNENKFFNNVPDSLEQNLAAIDDLGGPKYFNHYPWGWTWAGNTPFRRWKRETYPRRRQRPVHRPLAEGHQGQGRDPHPVRPRHRHGADRARRARRRAADVDPRRHPVADRRASASPTPSTTPRCPRSTSPSTSRCSATGRSTTTAGGRCARGRATRSPSPGSRSARRSPADTLTELDATGWELYHVAEDFAENHDLAADNRDRLIEMIAQWYVEAGKYNVLPIDGRGTLRFADQRPQLARTGRGTSTTRAPRTVPEPAPRGSSTAPHTVTAAGRDPRRRRRGRPASPRRRRRRLSLFVQDGKLHYTLQLRRRRAYFQVASIDGDPDAAVRSASSSSRPGQPDVRPRQGRAGRLPSSTSTANWSARPICP